VAFSFAPQSGVHKADLISGVVCLLLLVFLLLGRRRATQAVADAGLPAVAGPERTRRMSLPHAAALALAATVPLCLLFALRTGLFIFPGLTVILWRGIGTRALITAAAGLLGVVVPLVYLVTSPKNRGGYNFEYPLELIWAHWLGVAALVLLVVATGRMLVDARAARRRPLPPPPARDDPPPGTATGDGLRAARARASA
jgi:hypothetical protein